MEIVLMATSSVEVNASKMIPKIIGELVRANASMHMNSAMNSVLMITLSVQMYADQTVILITIGSAMEGVLAILNHAIINVWMATSLVMVDVDERDTIGNAMTNV